MTTDTDLLPRQDFLVDDAPLDAKIQLPRVPKSVSDTRRWLTQILTGWGVDADTIEKAELLVSEVCTNGIVHNAGLDDATVTAAWWHGHLRVTVSDPDLRIPVPDLADDEHGRGLLIVAELATRWGTTKTRNGKICWFELTSEDSL